MAVCPSGHDSVSDDFCDVCGIRIGGAAPDAPAATGTAAAAGTAGPSADAAAGPSAGDCPNCGAPRSGQFCEACGFDFSSGKLPGSAPPPSRAPAPETTMASAASPAPAASPDPAATLAAPVIPAAPTTAPAPPSTTGPVPEAAPASPATTPSDPGAAAGQAAWIAVVAADRAYYDSVQAASGPEAAAITFPAYCAERRFRLAGTEMRIGRHSASRGLDPEIDLTGPPADPGVSRLHAVLVATPDGCWAVLDPGSANGTLVNGNEVPPGEQVPLRDGDRINVGAWTAITIQRA
jgi:hypothetical protein